MIGSISSVAPEWTGNGLGSRLIEVAKRRRPGGLQLWTFQSNLGAQRFYERHGFSDAERTDGSGNEERANPMFGLSGSAPDLVGTSRVATNM